jgi:hypothetical protein
MHALYEIARFFYAYFASPLNYQRKLVTELSQIFSAALTRLR